MKTHTSTRLVAMLVVVSFSASAGASTKLLEVVPDDAFLTILVDRPQRALPPTLIEPAVKAVFGTTEAAERIGEAIKRIPGPFLLGFITPNKPQDEPSLIFACEMTGPEIDVDALMEKTFLPAVAAAAGEPTEGTFKVERGKPESRVVWTRNGEPFFAYAVKDKMILAASDAMLAKRWAQGEWPKRPWVNGPGIKQMIKRLPRESCARAFFNHAPLVRLAGKPKPNTPEEFLMKFWTPDDLIGTAIDLNWERNTLRISASLMLKEEAEGIAALLVQPASSAQALGVFPDDFVAVGRIGWANADRIATWLYKFTDVLDDTISAEYREELAEFERETGVDWNGGILGNMVGELAFGVRVDFTKPHPIGWAVVCPLGDAAAFSTNLDRLIEHFQLPMRTIEKKGLTVRISQDTTPFTMAIKNGRFLLADSANTIVDLVRTQAKKDVALPRNANLRRCYEALGDSNHCAVTLDIGLLEDKAPMIPLLAGPRFGQLLMDGTVGFAVKSEEGLVTVDLYWMLRNAREREDITESFVPGGDEALVMLAESLGASLVQARRQARRAVSMANMRGIGQALYIYASRHKDAFPGSIKELLRAQEDTITLNMLVSPYDGKGPTSIEEVTEKSYVVYRPGLTTASAPTEILLAERRGDGEGACFLFVDGHVSFIPEPDATVLLEMIERGEETVRWEGKPVGGGTDAP